MNGIRSHAIGTAASFFLLGVVLLVAVATARLLHDGQYHLREARRLLRTNDRKAAVVNLEDAAKSYVPGSPYPRRALRELEVLAKSAEMRGDSHQALAIWEVVRRSVLAARHFFQPNTDYLSKAEREIVRLTDARDSHGEADAKIIPRPRDPSPFASLLLFFGLAGWIGGAIVLCLAAPNRVSEKSNIRGYAWAACLGGLVLWIAMAWIAG